MFPKPSPRPKRRPNPGHPYLAWLKDQACCACGTPPPSEAAHVRGPVSQKTGLMLARRQDEAYVSAVPLCATCHRLGQHSIHQAGELKFAEAKWGEYSQLPLRAFSYLAKWIREGRP